MSAPLVRLREQLVQFRDTRAAEIRQRLVAASATDAARAGAPLAGVRVFDTVTGEEGIVAGHTTENLLVPTPTE